MVRAFIDSTKTEFFFHKIPQTKNEPTKDSIMNYSSPINKLKSFHIALHSYQAKIDFFFAKKLLDIQYT